MYDNAKLKVGDWWQHLPDCDSWTWQPEVWPKWYVPKHDGQKTGYRKLVAYYRCDAKNSGITVHTDGSQFTWEDWDNGHMKLEVTEAEALARVKPQESPDDWVEITDPEHVLRSGIDEYQSQWTRGEFKKATGGVYYKKDFSAVRCRRKDLPPLPSTKRVSVRLWIADDDDDPLWGYEIAACAEKPKRTHQPYEWRELFSDGNGGWFFEVQP